LPVAFAISYIECFRVRVYPQLATGGNLSGSFRKIRGGPGLYNAAIRNFEEEARVGAIGVETDFTWFKIRSSWTLAQQAGTLENNLDSRHVLKSEWYRV
jgi:hypothetical protein